MSLIECALIDTQMAFTPSFYKKGCSMSSMYMPVCHWIHCQMYRHNLCPLCVACCFLSCVVQHERRQRCCASYLAGEHPGRRECSFWVNLFQRYSSFRNWFFFLSLPDGHLSVFFLISVLLHSYSLQTPLGHCIIFSYELVTPNKNEMRERTHSHLQENKDRKDKFFGARKKEEGKPNVWSWNRDILCLWQILLKKWKKKASGQTNFQILVGNVGNPKCCISLEKRHLLQVCLQKKQGGVSSLYAWGWW